ncbi:hypothetical protein ABK040_000748 [Willaertia magna]
MLQIICYLLTTDNKLYLYGNIDDEYEVNDVLFYKFKKVNDFNSECIIISHLECQECFSVIIDDKNNFYINGSFINDSFDSFVKINFRIKKEIKFIRLYEQNIVVVTKNNYIYIYGNNSGEIGNFNDDDYYNDPPYLTKIKDLNLEIKDIQCGSLHIILLDNFGKIYVVGRNNYGQLGIGNYEDRYDFEEVNLSFKVNKIACNNYGTLLLNNFNELYGCGLNLNKELGLKVNFYKVFTKIVTNNIKDDKIKNIYNSYGNYNLIITFKNDIFVVGCNENEFLGLANEKKNSYKKEEFQRIEYFKSDKEFIYPILLSKILLFITTDYKIEEEDYCNENTLGQYCFGKLMNEQCSDLDITIQ